MRFEIPEKKKLVYQMTIPVRWGDMDTMGHVNNALYFRYMESARINWLHSINCLPDPQGEGVILASTFCNFRRPFVYPADILIKTYVTEPGHSSFETWTTMEKVGEPGVLYATGGATLVWLNFREGKSMPLPEWLRQVLTTR
ncbi:MAG: acyl-CoA thioesterase [Desulfobulbaceae bacterium]|jgi:acyl-CoA thioester hydrolase|nr:acyl-CoA thioesterase [Desulfobulbaceae bacterium]